jgi:hypothetical protein
LCQTLSVQQLLIRLLALAKSGVCESAQKMPLDRQITFWREMGPI